MARKLRMWEMMPDSAPEGTVMVLREAITPGEVENCLKDTLYTSCARVPAASGPFLFQPSL
jgi:hypothetical protein